MSGAGGEGTRRRLWGPRGAKASKEPRVKVMWPSARCSALSGEAGCLLQDWKPWGLRSQQLRAIFALFFKGTEGIC